MRNKSHIREARQFHRLISGARLFPKYVEHKTSAFSKQRAKEIKSQNKISKEVAI